MTDAGLKSYINKPIKILYFRLWKFYEKKCSFNLHLYLKHHLKKNIEFVIVIKCKQLKFIIHF